ncbi:MAG: amidohydrolase family protein [Anaerolineae bacterium]
MPQFPIVDTHLHVWDTSHLRYPWLDDIPLLNRPYLPADYDAACGDIQVAQMVFVQAEVAFAQYREETAWVTDLARQDPRLAGIVSWAPLERGDAARADLQELAQNPLVKGIRRIIQFEDDLGFCLRPGFVQGVRAVADYDLRFDLCIDHRHMANTIELVRQCPRVEFVLDHIGKPDIRARNLTPWREQIRTLADFPNVWCKVSGLVTEADRTAWQPSDLQPYIDHVIGCFGFDRVMFGGDFPVVLQAAPLTRWVAALDQALAGCSAEELHKLYCDNARAFYRLGS